MRFHFRRAVNFAIIVVGSLIVIHVLSTTTPTYNDSSVVTDSRQLAAVTRKSGNAAMNRTSPTRTAGAWTPVSITAMSTMTPSFRQRVHRPSIRLSAALRAANFSADTNEWHRESVVVRLPSQSSHSGSSNDGKSIWWWGSSPKTTNATLEPPRDRILQQMSYVPESYSIRRQQASNANSVKIIYVPGGGYTFKRRGKDKFEHCLVNACAISTDRRDAATSHMRLLYGEASLFLPSERVKPPGQIWVMYLLESPAYVVEIHNVGDLINWTATFRWDSTIVTPYAKFVPFPYTASTNSRIPSTVKNYAAGKTKMVVWFASNCFSRNKRGEYVEELSRYLPVDVFGMCGKPFCRRKDRNCWLRLRREYKFYLSFENSNCDYYITEKFFDNALRYIIQHVDQFLFQYCRPRVSICLFNAKFNQFVNDFWSNHFRLFMRT